MSRTRIVKGTYTKVSEKGHSMYSNENIVTNATKTVTEEGTEKGLYWGSPKNPPATTNKIIDIVMFVAGTTDPVNTTGEKHQANTTYWQAIDAELKQKTKESYNNFWHKIKELKPQFLNLHIEGDFFSWSGDNDTKERNLASERLLDLFLRTYKFWTNREVHLHLVGHSHGGNVINQFSELITSKEMIAKSEVLKKNKFTDFPKSWKIKSITYLSTPFFQKKHQLNHGKLHPNCKIINVHNEYDLTQQLIAHFSLLNMEGLLKSFSKDKFELGIKTLKDIDKDAILTYLKSFIWQDFENRGKKAWKEMANASLGIKMITQELINYVNSLKINNSNLQKEKNSLINLLNNFLQWTIDVNKNYSGGSKTYAKATFVGNLNLTQGLTVLNILFAIKSNPKDSYLLNLLAGIFAETKGITDSIDETAWTPAKQAKGLSILQVPIYDKDPYNSRNKKPQFKKFLKGAQNAVNANNLEELLMRLFSQFIDPESFSTVTKVIDWGIEPLVFGKLDTQVTTLRKNLKIYSALVTEYNADLVAEKDKEITDLAKKPGSLAYLAMASHSLSHTLFWKEVEAGLKEAFSSAKSAHYKPT